MEKFNYSHVQRYFLFDSSNMTAYIKNQIMGVRDQKISLINRTMNTMKRNRNIEYISLGEIDQIGASCHYLRLGDWGLLLDAGADPHGKERSGYPRYDLIAGEPVNAIIITHAHLDHLGSLPVAIRYFPHARIYMTPATAALSEIMLFHYLKVQEKKARQNLEKFEPPYLSEEVENLLYMFQSFDYEFPFKIHGFQESEIDITFWDAGHILGSAGVEIRWRGRRFFYTGNTKKSSQFILKGARYPGNSEILLTEATYGDNEEASHIKKQTEVKRFGNFISECLNFGGAVLIPVFALGRTQEIMMLLNRLIGRNQVPAVPVYLTGMGIQINRIYDRLLHKIYPQYDARLLRTITADTLQSKNFRKPSIVVSTSGMMMPNTLSFEIAGEFMQDPRNGIALVGWADPETPGGSLRAGKVEKIKEVFGIDRVLSRIETFYFSAHSHRQDLLRMIEHINPKKTMLCHGERNALEWMKKKLQELNLGGKVIIPEKERKITLPG